MKALNIITLILVIVGGLNWGLVGLFDFNLVTAIFGLGGLATIIYILVGLSALWQLVPLTQALSYDEPRAQAAVTRDTTVHRDPHVTRDRTTL